MHLGQSLGLMSKDDPRFDHEMERIRNQRVISRVELIYCCDHGLFLRSEAYDLGECYGHVKVCPKCKSYDLRRQSYPEAHIVGLLPSLKFISKKVRADFEKEVEQEIAYWVKLKPANQHERNWQAYFKKLYSGQEKPEFQHPWGF